METVTFRDFELRDLDFIHKCKTDAELNKMIVGNWKPFTREQSKAWLEGCIRADNPAYKFWAVATNDEEQRIVGWTSLSNIDTINSSAFFHGIVIGDPKYRNGFPWIEIQQFVVNYAFQVLKLNRLEFSCLAEHPTSMYIGPVMFFEQEGLFRQAIYKNNRYYDVAYFGLLKNDYFEHYQRGDYDFMSIVARYAEIRKDKKCKR